ncbi:hypothetical protein AB6A40_007282 [Gnathostoma spinigerum]|uniref:Uncharacterized protein n=1 Tax=Gnathostoma spinigerum TaxID=75299 RepID=A0ABD6EKR6_9BILA
MGVVLFSMCYFILQEEIREKAFEASRRARMSISKYSHSIIHHSRGAWSRRPSPIFNATNSKHGNESDTFEKLRKRRMSAPAPTFTSMSLMPKTDFQSECKT